MTVDLAQPATEGHTMRFSPPLQDAVLVRRYKRFLADIELPDGALATAHVANSGKMLGLDEPGSAVLVGKGTATLPYSLKFVNAGTGWAGVDTSMPSKLVAEALAAGGLPALGPRERFRAEVPYGERSRIDFLLEGAEGRLWLELKNVHLSRTPGLAEFPDCVAARSARHMHELARMVEAGDRACVLFVVQREDCDQFAPAEDLDPAFAAALRAAAKSGVDVLAYSCRISATEIQLATAIPVALRA
jgi:sugar fermentation stimulation protein A